MRRLMNWFMLRRQARKSFVLRNKRCPVCQSPLVAHKESGWQFDEQGNRTSHSVRLEATCPNCQSLTVDDPFVPDNDNEPMQVTPYQPDWVKCPCCGWRFCLRDTSSWRGGRHRKCGQRLENKIDLTGSTPICCARPARPLRFRWQASVLIVPSVVLRKPNNTNRLCSYILWSRSRKK
jgi:hypothetical protein